MPIVTQPGNSAETIYVGRSRHTDAMGIRPDGLKHGAFRIVSGDDWLVLLGRDVDFQPPDPWAMTRSDQDRAREVWDEKVADRTDAAWAFPFTSLFKAWWNPREYDQMMADWYGDENRPIWNPRDLKASNEYQGAGAGQGFWLHDLGGSLNAVYEFLRMQGVRWYMPGDAGEVVPERSTVELPGVDRTVRPDFPLRLWLGHRTNDNAWPGLIWERRIGMIVAPEDGDYYNPANFMKLVR